MSNIQSLPPELRDLVSSIRSSIADLKSNRLNQLSTDQSINQDLFNSLTNQIKDALDRINDDLNELEILADECEDESTRSDALQLVEENRNEATRVRVSLRTISLEVKRQLSNRVLSSSRAELLSGATSKAAPSNPEEALMSASSDVTQSLRNTLEIMRQELDRSVLSTHMLEQQTSTLQLTSDQYFTFGELMKTSKALITSLQRADLLDRILLSGAMLIFFLVCSYILKKRIFDRGISIFATVFSPSNHQRDEVTNHKIAVSPNNQNNPNDAITAAAALATTTAVALIPSLVNPGVPSDNPSAQEPTEPLLEPSQLPIPDVSSHNRPIDSSELGVLHEEL